MKKHLFHLLTGTLLALSFSLVLSLRADDIVPPPAPETPKQTIAPILPPPPLAQVKQEETDAKANQFKDWNFLVYMCNNNNLHQFGVQNFRQMVKVGSTPYLNILLQMDEYGEKEIMRFFIEQNNPIVIENQSNTATSFSGTPTNLFEFAQWGIKGYPSQKTCLVLWNHGAGIKDPQIWGRMLTKWRDKLFEFNKKTGLLELNRKLANGKRTMDVMLEELKKEEERGIAFNDVSETYLTNEDLKLGLENICKDLLGGKKIDVLAMDACHMAMVEIASQIKTAANFMVASEEVEPGAGYDYVNVLSPFATQTLDSEALARYIVFCYENEYDNTMGDYTQSAVNLAYTTDLEKAISNLSLQLIDLMTKGGNSTVKTLRQIRFSHILSTEFIDNDYIDLGHFLKSLSTQAEEYSTNNDKWISFFSSEKPAVRDIWKKIHEAAVDCLAILNKMIIANAAGKNLSEATGLAIYFPTTSIHQSYYRTEFAKATEWPNFLKKFTRSKKGKEAAMPITIPQPVVEQPIIEQASTKHVKTKKVKAA